MNKQYVIESKGFTKGIGSSEWKNKNKRKLEELKRQITELENNK